MAAILLDLGDDLANLRPEMPGANSPYAIVNHCVGVVDYWVGHLVAGRPVERDRPAEFTASGPVPELIERVEVTRRQLRVDLAAAEPAAPLRVDPPAEYLATKPDLTQGAALLHVFEELASIAASSRSPATPCGRATTRPRRNRFQPFPLPGAPTAP